METQVMTLSRKQWEANCKSPSLRDTFGRFKKGCENPNKNGEIRRCKQCNDGFWAVGSKIQEGKGKYCSPKCRGIGQRGLRHNPSTEFKKGENIGRDHQLWKGDNVGYGALHAWIHRNLGKASRCNNLDCFYPRRMANGCTLYKPKRFEWANISKKYKRDLKDWISLCVSCHQKWDRGIINIHYE